MCVKTGNESSAHTPSPPAWFWSHILSVLRLRTTIRCRLTPKHPVLFLHRTSSQPGAPSQRGWGQGNGVGQPTLPILLSGRAVQIGFPVWTAYSKFPCHSLFQQLLSNPGRHSENLILVQTSHLNMKSLGCNLVWTEILSFNHILYSIQPNNQAGSIRVQL